MTARTLLVRAGVVSPNRAGREALPITQVINIAEHGRSRRQLGERGEIVIEIVITYRGDVDRIFAALEDAGVVCGEEQIHHGSVVIEALAVPASYSTTT